MVELVFLVDYENIQPVAEDLQLMDAERHLLKIFHGPGQNSMPIKLATALLPIGPAVEFIQCEKAGKDALDFHLAFHLGRLTMRHPGAEFVIVSRDRKGFAQLVEHGTKLGCKLTLVPSMSEHDAGSKSTAAFVTATPAPTPTTTPAPPGQPTDAASTALPAKPKPTKKLVEDGQTPVKKAPAKKAPAKEAAVKKPAAKKATAGKTAAGKAVAARKLPAKKAVSPAPPSAPPLPLPVVDPDLTAADATPPTLPAVKPLRGAPTPPDLAKALASLSKVARDKRPAKAATLHNHLQSHLRAELTEEAIVDLLRTLFAQGWVSEGAGGKVEYQLPSS